MTFRVARHGAVIVVDVGPELSLRSGGDVEAAVAGEVESGQRQFVFDFARTEFIDSTGLGALISMSRLVHSHEGTVRLMRLNEDMRRLFELTKLDTLFDVVGRSAGDEGASLQAAGPRGQAVERPGPTH